MAASKSYFVKPNYLGEMNNVGIIGTDSMFELDESDVWNVSMELPKTVSSSRITKRTSVKQGAVRGTATESGPEWSKILKGSEDHEDNINNNSNNNNNKSVYDRIPPHELLARRRIGSFSVYEGIGRTLKGRDLRRVRNAVWEITGFEG